MLPGATGGAFQPPVYFLSLALRDAGFSVLAIDDTFDGEERTLALVGGTADPSWRPDAARLVEAEVVELESADHALAVEDDAIASLDMLRRAIEASLAFARRI